MFSEVLVAVQVAITPLPTPTPPSPLTAAQVAILPEVQTRPVQKRRKGPDVWRNPLKS